ncbi:hypothetical protein D9M69_492370 [compost metagenome]
MRGSLAIRLKFSLLKMSANAMVVLPSMHSDAGSKLTLRVDDLPVVADRFAEGCGGGGGGVDRQSAQVGDGDLDGRGVVGGVGRCVVGRCVVGRCVGHGRQSFVVNGRSLGTMYAVPWSVGTRVMLFGVFAGLRWLHSWKATRSLHCASFRWAVLR